MKKAKVLSLDRLIELVEDNLPDPRRPGGNIRHKLVDLLVIVLLGVICVFCKTEMQKVAERSCRLLQLQNVGNCRRSITDG